MGYVAARGGVEAIEHARHLVRYFRLRGGSVPLDVKQIQDQFRLAVDKVMGEGSLYSPFHAALALKQTEGDAAEAALMLRAFASTCPRTAVSCVADSGEMHVLGGSPRHFRRSRAGSCSARRATTRSASSTSRSSRSARRRSTRSWPSTRLPCCPTLDGRCRVFPKCSTSCARKACSPRCRRAPPTAARRPMSRGARSCFPRRARPGSDAGPR